MITPREIRQKAETLYPKVVRAWLSGDESFFPRRVPASLKPDADVSVAREAIAKLRDGSKEVLGYGYSIEWSDERRSRTFGANRFPQQVVFETRDDLLKLIRKADEFAALVRAVTQLREEFADRLDAWFPANFRKLADSKADVAGLIQVVRYFQTHPRPNVFPRELPLPVDTKFVERHQRLLSDWFELLLPPETIRADESQFERRYGLRYDQPLIRIRFLDPDLQRELGCPFDDLALPLSSLAKLAIGDVRVFIVENKTCLLTLPTLSRGIALGGLGKAAAILADVHWLETVPIHYWGDLDVEGFQILANLRQKFPRLQSVLMDGGMLDEFSDFIVPGSGAAPDSLGLLAPHEESAFRFCRDRNVRLEQERIPQIRVQHALDVSSGRTSDG
ncbi:hypothetical protein GC176_22005 [bacterium]|nr:hypothetical protein [bacterium]